ASAERLGDGCDDAEFRGAVREAPSLGNLAEIVRLQRFDRPFAGDGLDDLAAGDHVLDPPAVGVADVHVLDEAEDVAAAAEVPQQIDDAVFVLPADDDDV